MACRKPGCQSRKHGQSEEQGNAVLDKEEYLKFADAMMDKPLSFYAFEMLYWCGIREGELLALTPADFDLKGTVTISKSYQRLKGRDVITGPKTEKSNRTIKMPQFLCGEMQDYIKSLYGVEPNDRIFRSQSIIFITRWTGARSRPTSSALEFMTFGTVRFHY